MSRGIFFGVMFAKKLNAIMCAIIQGSYSSENADEMSPPPGLHACKVVFFRWESRRSKSYFSFSAFCNFSLSVATASEMIPTHLEDIPSSMAIAVSQ